MMKSTILPELTRIHDSNTFCAKLDKSIILSELIRIYNSNTFLCRLKSFIDYLSDLSVTDVSSRLGEKYKFLRVGKYESLIHYVSIEKGNEKLLDIFLKLGIEINKEYLNDGTPLMTLICMKRPEYLRILIDNKVDLEVENDIRWRPIHYISRYNPEYLKLLIDKVNLEAETRKDWRPIHFICRYHPEYLKLLINKVKLEVETNNNWRPIHFISRYHPEYLKLFIDKVNLEVGNKNNCRPIHIICRYHPEYLKLLLDKINLEAENKNNYIPIHLICKYHPTYLELLLAKNIDIFTFHAKMKENISYYIPIYCPRFLNRFKGKEKKIKINNVDKFLTNLSIYNRGKESEILYYLEKEFGVILKCRAVKKQNLLGTNR